MPRYELDGRFWEIALDGAVITTCSGTKARRGPDVPREYANEIAARRAYDDQIAARESAGYALVVASTSAATGARNDGLEAAIRAAPDAVDPYLVYADWLQARGDPRGELITLQHAMRAQQTPTEFARFKAHEEALRVKHAATWIGERLVAARGVRFEWAMGFVDVAVLTSPSWPSFIVGQPQPAADAGTVRDLLAELLASPCGWLVRVLTLEAPLEQLRDAFELLPTVRLRHLILHPGGGSEEDTKRELAPRIMDMLNANIDVDIGRYPPEKLRWKR